MSFYRELRGFVNFDRHFLPFDLSLKLKSQFFKLFHYKRVCRWKKHRIWLPKRVLQLALLFFLLPTAHAAIPKDHRHPAVASAVNEIGIVPTIVIDAGHGGQNLGAIARQPYCEEKRFTLLTTRYIRKYLNQLGYHVVLTRSTDDFIPLQRRVEIANKANADLFVSIHFNASRSPDARGIEVFFSDAKADSAKTTSSRKLASSVLTRVIRRTQAHSRGVKKADFLVIRDTEMPGILVEGGFISSPQERILLKDPNYLEKIARGVVEGIDHYFNTKKK